MHMQTFLLLSEAEGADATKWKQNKDCLSVRHEGTQRMNPWTQSKRFSLKNIKKSTFEEDTVKFTKQLNTQKKETQEK